MIPQADKKLLLKLARTAISSSFEGKKPDLELYKKFSEKQGVFVTLTKNGDLRGCIGYPMPYLPLWQAVFNSARSAAFEDPRFEQVIKDELKDIKIEISVLTVPERIVVSEAKDFPNKIKIGKDGLIIEYMGLSGLLLPQVATEYKWDARTFLENLCNKAGLSGNSWLKPGVKISKFQAEIFNESN